MDMFVRAGCHIPYVLFVFCREFEERTISGVKVGDTPTATHPPAPSSAVQEYSSLEMAAPADKGNDTSCGLDEEGQAPATSGGSGGVNIINTSSIKKGTKGVSSVMV